MFEKLTKKFFDRELVKGILSWNTGLSVYALLFCLVYTLAIYKRT